MGNHPWTEQQQAVLASRKGSILVSAAAGSGKTTVMVQRLLDILADENANVLLTQLLVVTFAKEAAHSMKNKLRDGLQKLIQAQPDNLWLRRQLELLPQANITTIDAFCQRILRDRITEIEDLDPAFRIAAGAELDMMKADALSDALEQCYLKAERDAEIGSDESDNFNAFSLMFGGTAADEKRDALADILLSLDNFTDSLPYPERWVDESVEAFANAGNDKQRAAEEYVRAAMTAIVNRMNDKLETIVHLQPTDLSTADLRKKHQVALAKYAELQDKLHQLREAVAPGIEICASMRRIKEIFAGKKFFAGGRLDGGAYLSPSDVALRKELKDDIDSDGERLVSTFIFLKAPDGLIYPALCGLRELWRTYRSALAQLKIEKNAISFSDAARYALRILRDEKTGEPTQTARETAERYAYICIDEYQDSNAIQELILTAVAKKNADGTPINLFMVGDVKQCIYRFRQSDPSIFNGKLKRFRANSVPDAKLFEMTGNFRSRIELLNTVNELFAALMTEDTAELDYNPSVYLTTGAGYPATDEPVIEFTLLNNDEDADESATARDDSDEGTAVADNPEMTWVADKINELLEQKTPVYDAKEGKWHDIRPSDIAVLTRKRRYAGALRKALDERTIPCLVSDKSSFFDTVEIRLMVNLLRLLDNPKQDIPLFGVMTSPIFGFKPEELVTLRRLQPHAYQTPDFFLAAERGRTEAEEPLRSKVEHFWQTLERWRKLASLLTIHDLLWKIYLESKYYAYVSAMPDGERRRANLDFLLEQSIEFESGSYSGLFRFLRYLEKQEKRELGTDEAKVIQDGSDAVRIMTIHASKGLEYPIVFMPDLSSNINEGDLSRLLLFDEALGIGPQIVDGRERVKYRSLQQIALKEKKRSELYAEEIRLLYVAMTRAKQKLYLSASVKSSKLEKLNLDEPVEKSGEYRCEASKLKRSYFDWLIDIYRHKPLSCFQLKLENAPGHGAQTVQADGAPTAEVNAESPAELFGWRYEHQYAVSLGHRFSVSEVKKAQHDDHRTENEEERAIPVEDLLKLPTDETENAEEKTTASATKASNADPNAEGALKGTAMHAFFAACDLSKLQSPEDIELQKKQMLNSGVLNAEAAALLLEDEILTFGKSELCRRMASSPKLYREQPFIFSMKIGELRRLSPEWSKLPKVEAELIGTPEGERLQAEIDDTEVMIQGIIDAFFVENEQIVLMDYKTDRYLSREAIHMYSVQLAIYQRAIESILGHRVVEKMLYGTRKGEIIRCEEL